MPVKPCELDNSIYGNEIMRGHRVYVHYTNEPFGLHGGVLPTTQDKIQNYKGDCEIMQSTGNGRDLHVGEELCEDVVTQGIKHDAGKVDYTYIPLVIIDKVMCSDLDLLRVMLKKEDVYLALKFAMKCYDVTTENILQVFEEGAKKYSRDNWKLLEPDRIYKAAWRHCRDGINEEDFGFPHMWHFCWCCVALMYLTGDMYYE
jgi:hypothetical protein